jgi:hypothetical protein
MLDIEKPLKNLFACAPNTVMQITIALFKGAEASILRMCKHLLKTSFDPETLSKSRMWDVNFGRFFPEAAFLQPIRDKR